MALSRFQSRKVVELVFFYVICSRIEFGFGERSDLIVTARSETMVEACSARRGTRSSRCRRRWCSARGWARWWCAKSMQSREHGSSAALMNRLLTDEREY